MPNFCERDAVVNKLKKLISRATAYIVQVGGVRLYVCSRSVQDLKGGLLIDFATEGHAAETNFTDPLTGFSQGNVLHGRTSQTRLQPLASGNGTRTPEYCAHGKVPISYQSSSGHRAR